MSRPTPYEIAMDLLATHYQGSALAFVAGSFRRHEETASSDIDLVVIFPKLECACRESFIYNGWPVEAFVHDPETLYYFISESDRKSGIPSLACMVVGGQAIPDGHPWNRELKSLAERELDRGPVKYSDEELQNSRYAITDLWNDLCSPKNSFEAKSIIGKLHEQLGDFWFRAQGRWSASGKQIPRRMLKLNPEFAKSWIHAFESAYAGESQALLDLSSQILDKYGGLFFDGYRRETSSDRRKTLPKNKDLATDIEYSQKISKNRESIFFEESILNHGLLGPVNVRAAEIKDIPQLTHLLNAAYRPLAELGLNYTATFQDDELTACGLLSGRTLVLESEKQLIGTVKLRLETAGDSGVSLQLGGMDSPILYLSRFAVLPNLQGQGLGLYLLNLAESIAVKEGCRALQLDTAQSAKYLLEFYSSQGFQIIRPIFYEGKTYTSWVLEKKIK